MTSNLKEATETARFGKANGEFRGGSYHNAAELRAWLAKRPDEAALEPDLPIIDPHHHFWDSTRRGSYLLADLLTDIGGGQNIVATVFIECRTTCRKHGPRAMAAVACRGCISGRGRHGRIRRPPMITRWRSQLSCGAERLLEISAALLRVVQVNGA